MSATLVGLWAAQTSPELQCTPESSHIGRTPANGYPVPIKLERTLEVDTSVGPASRTVEHHSSVSPPSAFTMDSDEITSSETDEELIRQTNDDGDVEMKQEPGSGSQANHDGLASPEQSTPTSPAGPSQLPAPKRQRGRPRNSTGSKATKASAKTTHGRSKTGCKTCRQRKKKCGEEKPECENCVKNNILCGGYAEKVPWATTSLLRLTNLPAQVPPVIQGLETDLDFVFYNHFCERMSMLLTLRDNDETNPFLDLVIPMAADHKGLMHSLLALSGSHLSRSQHRDEYEQRKVEHVGFALSALRRDVEQAQAAQQRGEEGAAEPLVACIIIQCLIPISEGSVSGYHRAHLAAARTYIKPRPGSDFGRFAWEFYKYHDMSNSITSLERPPLSLEELEDDDDVPTPVSAVSATTAVSGSGGFLGPPQPHLHMPQPVAASNEGVMIGVCDGLFRYITRITVIRDRIRARKQRGLAPVVEYRSIRDASSVGKRLLDWQSGHEERTPKWALAELYRETALVYLHRSLRASRPDADLAARVARGIAYLRALPAKHSAQSIVLLPTFVLGCAAFDPAQRTEIEAALEDIEAYSGLGNIPRASEVVHKVWEMMDAGDERSWDWETIMVDMGYNFLVT